MSHYREVTRSYKTARRLATAVVNGSQMKTNGYYYFFADGLSDDPVVIVDTTAPVGPATGSSIWLVEVFPHPWASEVAEMIWEGLDWDEVTEDSQPPNSTTRSNGWICKMRVEIVY